MLHDGEFVHLHNHTEYSLLDGACRIVDEKGNPAELLRFIASQKMPAVAITDHGNMFGAIEFYLACREVGLRPIIGCEIYVAPGTRFEKKSTRLYRGETNHHLTILCENNAGYENLLQLVTAGYLEGFYYKPRVDKELLKKYSNGLICLSGCLHGEIPTAILEGNMNEAEKLIIEYKAIFGENNFYLEIMDNGIPEQRKFLPGLIELSRKTSTPVVATNDCHYLTRNDSRSHDVLLCIGTGAKIDDTKRLRFPTDEFYYKTVQEMKALFSDIPEAIKNTIEIAERCLVEINFEQLLLPDFTPPEGYTPDSYLEKLCYEGLTKRYDKVTKELQERLEYELSVIKKMKFASYFLIVWDFVQYAKRNNIPVGPGRGSGAGSLVAYTLGITAICPLKYGLLFERFLNPDRRSMPDFDIDFGDIGREKVIDYVCKKYGKKNVAQIITFGTMQAKNVIHDVARVMGIERQEGDRIAKLIPFGKPLFHALKTIPELKQLYDNNEKIHRMIDIALKLEGLKRHTGVHAAGLVIAKEDITKYVPLTKTIRGKGEEIVTSQYNGDALLKLGLLKIDFLGLRTLTVIDECFRLIGATCATIPLDDKKTFKLISEGKTEGVFQLESPGMRELARKLQPTVFEDIIALISLFRPGPMGSGMIDEFISRKHKKTKVKYDHPLLEPILKDTYGVILYQEQVMKIATEIAGFSGSKADILRRAMGKKVPEEINQQCDEFIAGAKKKNIDKNVAQKIFNQISHFGGYGFNKSHSTAYALLAYQTAYLKANFPLQFMCALLTSEIGRETISKEEGSKLVAYIQQARKAGIEILPPDVQKSEKGFSIEGNAIRYSLLAIKNVGEAAVENIVSVRKKVGQFNSIQHFLNCIDTRQVTRRILESLVKAGAFDTLIDKERVLPVEYIRPKALQQLLRGEAQETLFSTTENEFTAWTSHELLNYEREVLGFYFSGHPLAQYKESIQHCSTHSLTNLPENNTEVAIAGMIMNIQRLTSKSGNQWVRMKLENLDSIIDVIIFPQSYKQGLGKYLKLQELVVIKGRLNYRENIPEIIANEIVPLQKVEQELTKTAKGVYLKFSAVGDDDTFIEGLKNILTDHPGSTTVYFQVITPDRKEILIETGYKVNLSDKFFISIEHFFGNKNWYLV